MLKFGEKILAILVAIDYDGLIRYQKIVEFGKSYVLSSNVTNWRYLVVTIETRKRFLFCDKFILSKTYTYAFRYKRPNFRSEEKS